ncbi:MAG: TrkH family potassium uptake protein, partial [Rhodobacteraceae bacterium]|nr:TrkH family potassium uptake protein [Paracoccaceae bacterium]
MELLRPVLHLMSLLLVVVAVLMLVPLALDLWLGNDTAFGASAVIVGSVGVFAAIATRDVALRGIDLRQAFLVTTGAWVVVPLAGALPFMLGAPGAGLTDALFEAMSGVTTTGSTVFTGLDDLPEGVNLWRGMLQWLGGLGIIIVAMLFLPIMKVGGMQYFRAEAFDTMGKVMPRALDISASMVRIYLGLTIAMALIYTGLGMPVFDATVHALTSVSTGGFSTRDSSFVLFSGPAEYAAVVFMLLAGLPFVRYVQLVAGSPMALFRDVQVRAYLRWTAYAVGAVALYRLMREDIGPEQALRETAFNVVAIFSGTGYGSADVTAWGPFAFVVLFLVGLIGSCTASTGCSIKVFRYLVLLDAIRQQIREIHSPHGIFRPHYDGQPVAQEVLNSIIAFFTLFMLTFGVLAVALALAGLQFETAVTAAWTAIANIGPAFGPAVGPTGAMGGFAPAAKGGLLAGMLLGRRGLLAVVVL